MYLDKNAMLRLMIDHSTLRSNTMLSYGIVGLGGKGKTTLACNIAHFHDTKFNNSHLVWNYKEMAQRIEDDGYEMYRATVVDEPNDKPPTNSKASLALAEIFGQMRQICPVLIVCSTDLQDIHPTVFRKLNALFYINARGYCTMIRDAPEREEYPLSDIKRTYQTKGYKAFKDIIQKSRFPHLRFTTIKSNVLFDIEDGMDEDYLKQKKAEFKKSIGKLIDTKDKNNVEKAHIPTKKDLIEKMLSEGKNNLEILKEVKCTIDYVNKTKREWELRQNNNNTNTGI